MTRACGGCTACCKIMPVPELDKPALTRCRHQRFRKGCAIYAKRPMSCRLWSCRWLAFEDETPDLRRPDHAHYVIDMMPDYVTLKNEGQPDVKRPVVQVWIDPAYPDAHEDPALRDYLDRNEVWALVRIGSLEAFVIAPPSTTVDRAWHVERSNVRRDVQHSFEDVLSVLKSH